MTSFVSLPDTSFVSVINRKLKRPKLAWTSDSFSEDALLALCSFCLPLSGESHDDYIGKASIAGVADRYGGTGIGVNGGSGRCVTYNGFSIKGAGQTPLVGQGAPYWHSYGGASLREAIREAVWGEVLDLALPFGALKVHGIICTNTHVPLRYPNSLGQISCPRVLIIRSPVLRPAHFLPSALFRPRPLFASECVKDAVRTENALRSLTHCLREAVKIDWLEQSLIVAYKRYATQASVARAKRLIHGSISPSNISLDGRLLDFGMSSSIADYGKLVIARGCPDSSQQHQLLRSSISDLLFCLQKFRILGRDQCILLFNSIKTNFDFELDFRFRVELIKLTGVPSLYIEHAPREFVFQVSSVFYEIISAGNAQPQKLLCPCPEYIPFMPKITGRYSLQWFLSNASTSICRFDLYRKLVGASIDGMLAERFAESYWMIRKLDNRKFSSMQAETDVYEFTTFRLNVPFSDLYSFNLNKCVDEIIVNSASISSFISDIRKKAELLFKEEEESDFEWNHRHIGAVRASASNGVELNGARLPKSTWRPLFEEFLNV